MITPTRTTLHKGTGCAPTDAISRQTRHSPARDCQDLEHRGGQWPPVVRVLLARASALFLHDKDPAEQAI